ncbi:ABC transporter ATP-binding protein [Phaeovulum sp. NW3]|uniref:ABC transporter ATP-binding protein n=1 Tax=Phaeovulum sp. NW3 TaxID=2934933 RepID=UPI0020206B64|nr:ABC transporter ATP-binding protein [Phaeovulum sp. NW3]MCL7466734.1 ABC transporter ATP-binding protein [Phaeovulum sp. NW3]
MTVILEARDIRKSYGAVPILKGVDLDLTRGGTHALIGPNGAGKTTLFKVLTGETPANGGSVRFSGKEIVKLPAFRRVQQGIGRTFQVARVFMEMTALENIMVTIERRMRMAGEKVGVWYDFRPSPAVRKEAMIRLSEVGLENRAETEARYLSHGDKKRLELSLSLTLEPEILMLDEPTAGMSQSDRHETVALLKRLKAERGFTMLMTEHDMDVVFGLADAAMVLNYGEIIACGTPEAVRRDPLVREVYLGQEATSA